MIVKIIIAATFYISVMFIICSVFHVNAGEDDNE